MNEIKQNENEPLEHYELRYLLQEAKAIVLPCLPISEGNGLLKVVSLRRSTPFLCSTPNTTKSLELS